jgi:hypothetical protein
MSSLKYKLLLWVVALMVLTIPLYAADVVFWTETFGTYNTADSEVGGSDYEWTLSSGSSWEIGLPVGTNGDPGAAPSLDPEDQILGYDLGGLYTNGMTTPKYAISPEIDCTDTVGVKLTFDRWLGVEDSAEDQAFIQVTNDGENWVDVWMNPSFVLEDPGDADPDVADLVDASWKTVVYDISEVADGQEAVQIRFGLATGGASATYDPADPNLGRFGGWNIDNVELSAAGPDGFNVPTWAPDVDGSGNPVGSIWENGPPVATAGHPFDADGDDDTADDPVVGGDPGVDASDGAGPIWGTDIVGTGVDNPVVAGDYKANMRPDYLVSSAFDCTGRNGTQVSFMRWLQVAAAPYDNVSVQVQVGDPDDGFVPEEIFSEDADPTIELTEDGDEFVWEVDTTDAYRLAGAISYIVDGKADATAEVEFFVCDTNSDDEDDWTSVGTVPMDADLGSIDDDEWEEFDFGILPRPLDCDNGSLFVKAVISNPDEDVVSMLISNLTVEGDLWHTAWTNPVETPLAFIFDGEFSDDSDPADEHLDSWAGAWVKEAVDISEWADDNSVVRVRFAMGPTVAFLPKYGGWSLDQLEISEASRGYRGQGLALADDAPLVLQWDEAADFALTIKNTGTASWDSRSAAYEALAVTQDVVDDGQPSYSEDAEALIDTIKVETLGSPFPISRWAVDSIAVGDEDEVAPDESYDFEGTLVAPPLSSLRYATPVEAGVTADLGISALDCAFAMGDVLVPDGDPAAFPFFTNAGVANTPIIVTRFSDVAPDDPGVNGEWARFEIESLAGKVPLVVQGFGKGDFRPKGIVKRDALAVFTYRVAELPAEDPDLLGSVFLDVSDDNSPGWWAVNEIQACYHAGIIQGYSGHVYHPTNPVKRSQMAKFLVNGINFVQPATYSVPTTADITAALEADEDLAYPFEDVAMDDPETEDENEIDPLAGFILALSSYVDDDSDWATLFPGMCTLTAPVTTGYAAIDEDHLRTFKPNKEVTRDTLSVFVWRGYMRDFPSVVVLGGPGITGAIAATDLISGGVEAP